MVATREQLLGYVDVDLGFTPSTNTLPIQRLCLPIQGKAEITCAWIRYPSLAFEPLVQRYTRLSTSGYLYESGAFRAELEVDESGLVQAYQGGWKVVAQS